MREPETGELTRVLLDTPIHRLGDYRTARLTGLPELRFAPWYCELLREKGIRRSDAAADSGLEIHYAYQILSGLRRPGRDKLLCLCIGGRLTLAETQRALARAEAGALYPKRLRDAVIMLALNRGIHPVWRVNELLAEQGEALLG